MLVQSILSGLPQARTESTEWAESTESTESAECGPWVAGLVDFDVSTKEAGLKQEAVQNKSNKRMMNISGSWHKGCSQRLQRLGAASSSAKDYRLIVRNAAQLQMLGGTAGLL